MLILITRHLRVLFEEKYLSNIEHDVKNTVFITFVSGVYV